MTCASTFCRAFSFDALRAAGVDQIEGSVIPDWTVEICPSQMCDPAFDLMWVELDQQGATELIHSAVPVATYGVTPSPGTDYPVETARIASDLLWRGAPQRFPQIKFVLRLRAVGSERSPRVCLRTRRARARFRAIGGAVGGYLSLLVRPSSCPSTKRHCLAETFFCRRPQGVRKCPAFRVIGLGEPGRPEYSNKPHSRDASTSL